MRPSTLFAAAALALGVSASPIANSTTTATSTATTTTTGTNSVSTGNPWDSCSNICVLIAGDDPKVIVPFKRPPCACACMKSACTSVTVRKPLLIFFFLDTENPY